MADSSYHCSADRILFPPISLLSWLHKQEGVAADILQYKRELKSLTSDIVNNVPKKHSSLFLVNQIGLLGSFWTAYKLGYITMLSRISFERNSRKYSMGCFTDW